MLSTDPPGLADRPGPSGALGELTRLRIAILDALAEYRELSAVSSDWLDMYRTRIVAAMHALHDTVRERRFLEAEYERIRQGVAAHAYASRADLESDVRAALDRAPVEDPDDLSAVDEPAEGPAAPAAPDADFPGDEEVRKRLLGEFKRVVLPRIHSDTAPDASFDDFEFAFGAYRQRDYLLMAALVVQYRGDIEPKLAEEHLGDYRRVLELMVGRVAGVRGEMTPEELAGPEEVRRRIERRRERVSRAIREEAERVTVLRQLIEDLACVPDRGV